MNEPPVMSFQMFKMWIRDRCADDGVLYSLDDDTMWSQYTTYLQQRARDSVIAQQTGVVVSRDRSQITTLLTAIKDFFQLGNVECMREWRAMSLKDRDEIRGQLIKEGYVNLDPRPSYSLTSSAPVPMLPAVIPPHVPVTHLPHRPLDESIPDVGGYVLGDQHPSVQQLPKVA